MSHPPTQTEIKAMLAAAGLAPEKRYGQHFLIDGNLMRMLVDEADIGPADTVLEVGPGVGNLTELLVERAGHVVAVEINPAIAEVARGRLAGAANLDFLVTDILANKHTVAPEVLALLDDRRKGLGGPLKLVANLPYQAATPLVAELVMRNPPQEHGVPSGEGGMPTPPLRGHVSGKGENMPGERRAGHATPDSGAAPASSYAPLERLVFTVQEEVAARFAAEPGTSDYGPVGVIVQALGEVEVLRRLGPSVFWPRPRVWSAMVRIRPDAARRKRIRDLALFRRTIHGLFVHRRKRAARSLSLADASEASPETWTARLKAAGLESEARGETYTVEEIVRLANSLADV